MLEWSELQRGPATLVITDIDSAQTPQDIAIGTARPAAATALNVFAEKSDQIVRACSATVC